MVDLYRLIDIVMLVIFINDTEIQIHIYLGGLSPSHCFNGYIIRMFLFIVRIIFRLVTFTIILIDLILFYIFINYAILIMILLFFIKSCRDRFFEYVVRFNIRRRLTFQNLTFSDISFSTLSTIRTCSF